MYSLVLNTYIKLLQFEAANKELIYEFIFRSGYIKYNFFFEREVA